MKGFYIYNLILEVVLLNTVDCRITSEEVYSLLSQRIHLENTLLKTELKELKAVVKKQDEKIAALGLSACRTPETAEDAKHNHQDLEERITVMQHAFQSEKELVRGIKSNISALASKPNRQKVAFSAELSRSRELAIGSTIVFDQIIYQDGSGYNSADGVFTCPETGVYMFSIVLHCWHEGDGVKTLAAKLMVDSEGKSIIVSESQPHSHNDQASNLVILSVNQGQKVWVQTFHTNARVHELFSTFSGALLYN